VAVIPHCCERSESFRRCLITGIGNRDHLKMGRRLRSHTSAWPTHCTEGGLSRSQHPRPQYKLGRKMASTRGLLIDGAHGPNAREKNTREAKPRLIGELGANLSVRFTGLRRLTCLQDTGSFVTLRRFALPCGTTQAREGKNRNLRGFQRVTTNLSWGLSLTRWLPVRSRGPGALECACGSSGQVGVRRRHTTRLGIFICRPLLHRLRDRGRGRRNRVQI